MPFKTVRPPGAETFESARSYFERGRQCCFLAADNGSPYLLRATFRADVSNGTAEDGEYVDTWKGPNEWRRESSIGASRYVRAQHGEQRYQWAEGPETALLRLVVKVMEPIPAIDTFVESDWRIRRDAVDGMKTVRVLSGYESPTGELDPEHARGYWFDESGKLVKTYFMGIETLRSEFGDFGEAQIAHQIMIVRKGMPELVLRVTQVSPLGAVPERTFELPGHEWNRAFTDEVR